VSQLARVRILDIPDDEDIDDEFDEFSDEYDYAEELVGRSRQRGGGAQGPNRLKSNGPRNPRLRKQ